MLGNMCTLNSRSCLGDLEDKKNVVIIGGGVGGSLLAYTLQFSAHVFLIDEKEYFDIPWARLRAIVEPSFAERSVINHSEYLTAAKIVASSATNITDGEVLTADGHTYAYDYLVIATGHIDSGSRTKNEKLSLYQAECEKIKSSNSVLIIGGGPTGVELAGEIVCKFPDKRLTIVHRGSRLLEFVGTTASHKALDWLRMKKVQVILDQSINLNYIKDNSVQTSSGEIIKADCHFKCTGKPMGSVWLRNTILKNSMDLRERLMVDENLRVRGCKNVFAIGDITDIQEIKQGNLAQRHALLTAKNIKILMTPGNKNKLGTYKAGFASAFISLGRKDGVAQYPLMTLSGYIPGKIKSEDLFVGETRRRLGLKP